MRIPPALEDLGLSASAEDLLASSHASRVGRTLGIEDGHVASGTLPLTWIWTFFTPTAPTAALRDDGHPAVRENSPLAGLDRRMFIGGSLERNGDIRLDTLTERSSTVVGAEEKDGRTGPFVLVDIEHEYRQGGEIVLVERQQVMYRTPPAEPVPASGPAVPAEPSRHQLEVRPDERLLFRYSALTFNTHRIHYDLPYATEVEGYPGLVVHGPLTATLLAMLAADVLDRPVGSFSFRATSPTFANVGLILECSEPSDDTVELRAVREDGVTVMTARAS